MGRARRLLCTAFAAVGLLAVQAGFVEVGIARADCDEGNPNSPARDTRITLGTADLVEESGTELRTFIETGSLGKTTATLSSSSAGQNVRALSAVPETNRYSPLYGEGLKGIEVAVTLDRPQRAPRIVIDLRQVCAKYFRNSFLY